jgi:hypothetical protein
MKKNGKVLLAALKALHQSERVLSFHDRGLNRAYAWDFQSYIEAMLGLCRERHCAIDGMKHLRELRGLFDQAGGQMAPDQVLAGENASARYEQWLCSAFPQAFARIRDEERERARKQGLN